MEKVDYKKIVLVLSFVTVSLSLLIFGGGYVCGYNFFKKTNTYYFTVTNCKGLNSSVLVYLNGYNVGAVRDIIFDKKNFTSKISFSVDENIKLTKNSYIKIETPLFGDKFIILNVGDGELLESNENVRTVENQMDLGEVITKAKDIADSMNVFLKKFNKEKIPQNVNNVLFEINELLKSLKENNVVENTNVTLKKVQDLIQSGISLVEDIKGNPRKYLKALL